MIRRLGLLVLAAGLAAAAPAEVVGPARVADGDTFNVGAERVRLWGVDAPEGRQICQDAQGQAYACGDVARDELVRLIGGRAVHCQVRDRDPYGRAVSRCQVGSIDPGEAMVRAGWAVDYAKSAAAPMRQPRERPDARGGGCGLVASRRLRPGGPRSDKRDRRRPRHPRPAAPSRATSTPRDAASITSPVSGTMRRPASTRPRGSAGSVPQPRRRRRAGRRRPDEARRSPRRNRAVARLVALPLRVEALP